MDHPDPLEPGDDEPSIEDILGGMFGGSLDDVLGGAIGALKGVGGGSTARQLAMAVATGGKGEPNVEPTVRMEYEALARVAELHVADRTGLSTSVHGPVSIEPATRAMWAARTVDALRPLLGQLSGSLHADEGEEAAEPTVSEADPAGRWLTDLMESMAPLLADLTTGTMVGRLAGRNLGTYDLPIPRDPAMPGSDRLQVVVPNIERFAAEWSLPADDLRLWVCLHEMTNHAVLCVPHVGSTLTGLLTRHAGAFRNDPSALEAQLGGIDPMAGPEAIAQLQGMLDPEAVLGAVRSPEQEELLPRIEALVAVLIGFVDHVMDETGGRLIGSYPMLTEALRRRRVETSAADRFVERILGLNLTQAQVDRGTAFVSGVLERAGRPALDHLWATEEMLPTPNEVDAPGLWLARIEMHGDGLIEAGEGG